MSDTRSESEMAADLQATLAAANQAEKSMTAVDSNLFRHLSPIGQPESVHEISDALYRPFQIAAPENTSVRLHLAGCHIDLVPFLQSEDGKYFLMNGTQVSDQHATSLGLDDLEERTQLPHLWSSKFERQKIASEIGLLGKKVELATATDGRQWLVWCSHVHGVLVAETDESSVSVPFSLWGNRLKKGLEKCPPYHCPLEKTPTYSLDCDDEGTISNAESILRCPETNRRLLSSKLGTCLVSGKRLAPEVLAHCPINDDTINQNLVVSCKGCFQAVAPNAIQRGRCLGCRQLTRLIMGTNAFGPSPLDEAFQQIKEKHPALAEMKKVKLAAQPKAWLLQGKLGKINWIIVVEKATLDVQLASRSNGWLKPWEQADRSDWPV